MASAKFCRFERMSRSMEHNCSNDPICQALKAKHTKTPQHPECEIDEKANILTGHKISPDQSQSQLR